MNSFGYLTEVSRKMMNSLQITQNEIHTYLVQASWHIKVSLHLH